jgi:hypothetical protein
MADDDYVYDEESGEWMTVSDQAAQRLAAVTAAIPGTPAIPGTQY